VLDFCGDLYGQWVRVELIAELRPQARFVGIDELVAQLHRDVEDVRRIFDRGERLTSGPGRPGGNDVSDGSSRR